MLGTACELHCLINLVPYLPLRCGNDEVHAICPVLIVFAGRLAAQLMMTTPLGHLFVTDQYKRAGDGLARQACPFVHAKEEGGGPNLADPVDHQVGTPQCHAGWFLFEQWLLQPYQQNTLATTIMQLRCCLN